MGHDDQMCRKLSTNWRAETGGVFGTFQKNINLKVKLLWWLFTLEMFTFNIHFFDYLSPNTMNEYQFNIWTKFLESWT